MPHARDHAPLVLVVDNEEWTARSIESVLGTAGTSVLRAHSGKQALELARKARPDAVIVDVHLPDTTGMQLCSQMRQLATIGNATPILLLAAGPLRQHERLSAIRAGAWDILGPPVCPEELILKLSLLVATKMDGNGVLDVALRDPVTGLYNGKGIMLRLEQHTADASRNERPLSCVVIGTEPTRQGDTDRTCEPVVWEDRAIRVGRTLEGATRLSDTVGCLSPTDYAIIAPGADQEGAGHLALRVLEALAASPELAELAGEAGPGLKAGICSVPDPREEPLAPLELLSRATAALRRDGVRRGKSTSETETWSWTSGPVAEPKYPGTPILPLLPERTR